MTDYALDHPPERAKAIAPERAGTVSGTRGAGRHRAVIPVREAP